MHNQAYLLNLLDYNSWANDEFFPYKIPYLE